MSGFFYVQVDPEDGQLLLETAPDPKGRRRRVALLTGQLRCEAGALCVRAGPWKPRARRQDERAVATYLPPLQLQAAVAMLKTRLAGVEVLVSEEGVVVLERRAATRQRVELACIWLNLAAAWLAGLQASQQLSRQTAAAAAGCGGCVEAAWSA